MTAEEFKELSLEYGFMHGLSIYSNADQTEKQLFKLAEAYHKQEVEAISDEEIDKHYDVTTKLGHWDKEVLRHRSIGAKWFKNKLLKQ